MQTIQQMGAQGDVLFRRIEALPKEAKPSEGKDIQGVLVYSDSGHHHVLESGQFKLFTGDELVSYIKLETDSVDVVHTRPYDTHETIRLTGGPGTIWQVLRQREHTPEGWRMVAD